MTNVEIRNLNSCFVFRASFVIWFSTFVIRNPRSNSIRSPSAFLQPKPLHAMIVRVEDIHAALGVAGDDPGLVELAFAAAVLAEGADEFTFGRELLHAMVAVLAQLDIPARLA